MSRAWQRECRVAVGFDILCFSSTDWDGIWGSRQQVMLRFARRGYRVLFFERPAVLEHLARYPDVRRRKLRRWREGLHEAAENLWIVSQPPLLPGRYYSQGVNSINQWLTVRWSRPYLKRLGFEAPILWIYNPEQGALVGQFGACLGVYHCIDEFTAGTAGRKRRIIMALEADLLRRVDVVFANSRLTFENKRLLHSNVHRIPSGADVEHFAQALDPALPLHSAIAEIPNPVAGFLGNITDRFDVSLLVEVVHRLPDWQFVFVGQVYPQSVDISPLLRLPNTHFLGRYPFIETPALVKGMDVCLLPNVEDERGRYRSPLKLYEYLAAGKPVVSSQQPEAREFGEVIYLAATPADFARQITRALAEDNSERRQRRLAIAGQHSWDLRVDEMERVMRGLLETQGDG
jgi:glycosyltransferase involved in cell wall biosynthesis